MFPYCTQFGFDKEKIQRRLAFLYLSKEDHELAALLHNKVIAPNIEQIITRFYEILLFQSESRKVLAGSGTIDHLKNQQKKYLLSLGLGFDTPAYFEGRLAVGMTHAAIHLPLSLYQCAYRVLTQIIIDCLPPSIADDLALNKRMISFLIKITALDMSLAVETYHSAKVTTLKETVEELHLQKQRLRSKAEIDPLTLVFNRETAFEGIEAAVETALQTEKPFCVLMIDLDYFKKINDTHGHFAGDKVLKHAAARIADTLRKPDIVGRYGGEEFIAGLVDTDIDTARAIADRILHHVSDTPIRIQGLTINVTTSIGISSLKRDDDISSLIHRADKALYAAKGAGRNCVMSEEDSENGCIYRYSQ